MENDKDKIINEITMRLRSASSEQKPEYRPPQKISIIDPAVTRAILLGTIIGALACYAVINASNIKKHKENQLVSTSAETGKSVDIYDALPDLSITVEGVVPLPPRYDDINGI